MTVRVQFLRSRHPKILGCNDVLLSFTTLLPFVETPPYCAPPGTFYGSQGDVPRVPSFSTIAYVVSLRMGHCTPGISFFTHFRILRHISPLTRFRLSTCGESLPALPLRTPTGSWVPYNPTFTTSSEDSPRGTFRTHWI